MSSAARSVATVAFLTLVLALGSGCGSVYYAAQVNSAESRLEQARAAGAAESAPYEFYFAEEHLKKAKSEAAEASYGDAAQLAEIAEEYAKRAIDMAKAQKR